MLIMKYVFLKLPELYESVYQMRLIGIVLLMESLYHLLLLRSYLILNCTRSNSEGSKEKPVALPPPLPPAPPALFQGQLFKKSGGGVDKSGHLWLESSWVIPSSPPSSCMLRPPAFTWLRPAGPTRRPSLPCPPFLAAPPTAEIISPSF